MDFKKYFFSMPTLQLERLLRQPKLPRNQSIAIKEILRDRRKSKERQEKEWQAIQRNRPKKHSKSMFRGSTAQSYKIGRIRQGGKVSPR